MGGQKGGMTDEQGMFPSVCNKSVQAQSTDIQAPIPESIFDYSIEDFRELSAMELEHIGRLGTPIFKAANKKKISNCVVGMGAWPDGSTIYQHTTQANAFLQFRPIQQ